MADGLEADAVGVEDERAVVGRVVLLVHRRRQLRLGAGGERRLPEPADAVAVVRGEGEVDVLAHPPLLDEPEERLEAHAVAVHRELVVLGVGGHDPPEVVAPDGRDGVSPGPGDHFSGRRGVSGGDLAAAARNHADGQDDAGGG